MPVQTSLVTMCLPSVSAVVQQEERWPTRVLDIVIEIWVPRAGGLQRCMAGVGNGLKIEFCS